MKTKEMFLSKDKWVRPEVEIDVKGVVIHWVANPNSTAIGNRNFFENRTGTYGSAHYIVGLDGEVIQCLPENEMGYHVGSRIYSNKALNELSSYPNAKTVGIECTHVDWDGKMTDATYESVVKLSADILNRHGLNENDLWTHEEVVIWKDCHRWFVNNPSEWNEFKKDVAKELGRNPSKVTQVSRPIKEDIVVVEADAFGMYEIKKGDTLWGLSVALDVPVKELERLNPNIKASALQIGKKIKVEESNVVAYKIKKGDTLWDIATKFNTTVSKLNELNKGVQAKALQVGAKIAVPNSGTKKSTPVKPKPKPKPKHSHKFARLGRSKGSVWSHTQPDFKASTRKEVVATNARLEVCCEENGLYYTNKGWISKKYVDIVGDLNSYDLPSVILRRGSRGSNVVKVQRALNKLYFKVGAEDGSYGVKTENAIKRFQSMYTSPVTGVYSSRVEKAMEKQLIK